MAWANSGSLNNTMPAPIGTYICLWASIVTESASSIPASKWRYLLDNKLAPPQAASTWKWQFNSFASAANSVSGSTLPVSVVPATPTIASTLMFLRASSRAAWRILATSTLLLLSVGMLMILSRPMPSRSTALPSE